MKSQPKEKPEIDPIPRTNPEEPLVPEIFPEPDKIEPTPVEPETEPLPYPEIEPTKDK